MPDRIQRAADYARQRLDADIEVIVAAVASCRIESTSMAWSCTSGDAFGAHGYLRPSPTDLLPSARERTIPAGVAPTPLGAVARMALGDGGRHMAGGDFHDRPEAQDSLLRGKRTAGGCRV